MWIIVRLALINVSFLFCMILETEVNSSITFIIESICMISTGINVKLYFTCKIKFTLLTILTGWHHSTVEKQRHLTLKVPLQKISVASTRKFAGALLFSLTVNERTRITRNRQSNITDEKITQASYYFSM